MYTRVLGLTISALILAYGAVGAIAQDRMTQPDQQQMQSYPMGQEDAGTMGHGRMTWRDMMGEHMTGRVSEKAFDPISRQHVQRNGGALSFASRSSMQRQRQKCELWRI